jgi:DNA polymerase III alpha subunit (gram-positive type)
VGQTTEEQNYVAQGIGLFEANDTFCVFDLETTNKLLKNDDLNDPLGRVMQIAAQRFYRQANGTFVVGERLDVLLNDPTMTFLHPGAYETHNISIEDCRARGIDPRLAWEYLLEMAAGAVLVGHNCDTFDIPFANRELARWGLPDDLLSPAAAVDTVQLSRILFSLPNHRLQTVAEHLGVRVDGASLHNAGYDIDVTWGVLRAMEPHLRGFRRTFLQGTPDQYKWRLGHLNPALLRAS